MEKADTFRMFLSIVLLLMVLVCAGVAVAFKVPPTYTTTGETMAAQIYMSDSSAQAGSALANHADIGLADTGVRSTSSIMADGEAISPNVSAQAAGSSPLNLSWLNSNAHLDPVYVNNELNKVAGLNHSTATEVVSEAVKSAFSPAHMQELAAKERALMAQERGLSGPADATRLNPILRSQQSSLLPPGVSPQWQSNYQQRMRSTELGNEGTALASRGNLSEAESLAKQGLTIAEKSLGPTDIAARITNLADVYAMEQKYDLAEPLYKRSLAMWKQVVSSPTADQSSILFNGVASLEDWGKTPTCGPAICPRLDDLAYLYTKEGRNAEAESLYRQSLNLQRHYGPNDPYLPNGINHLADILFVEHKYAESEKLYKESLSILVNNTTGFNSLPISETSQKLAAVLKAEGKQSELNALLTAMAGNAK